MDISNTVTNKRKEIDTMKETRVVEGDKPSESVRRPSTSKENTVKVDIWELLHFVLKEQSYNKTNIMRYFGCAEDAVHVSFGILAKKRYVYKYGVKGFRLRRKCYSFCKLELTMTSKLITSKV